MLKNEIHIGYDRKNGLYIAYNVENNIFATGICVESAADAYRSKYYEIPVVPTDPSDKTTKS